MKNLIKYIPESVIQKLKTIYYGWKQRKYRFSYTDGRFKTRSKSWGIITTTPLYFITKEIERYEKFYSIKNDDTIIDAGAFHGILSLVYSKKSAKGIVYSFEPDSKNLKRLEENLILNNKPENIAVLPFGLWSKSGEIVFFEDGSVASSSFYQAEHSIEKKINVISLDDFIFKNNISKVDFIKMDVEGAELSILEGAKRVLTEFQPNLSIATYHWVNGELTYKSVEMYLTEIGYPFRTEFFKDGEIITYAGPQVAE